MKLSDPATIVVTELIEKKFCFWKFLEKKSTTVFRWKKNIFSTFFFDRQIQKSSDTEEIVNFVSNMRGLQTSH